MTFQVGGKVSRPRLRPLRSPALAGTAGPWEGVFLTFRVGDKLSRPDLRPFRSPGLGRTAGLGGESVLTFQFLCFLKRESKPVRRSEHKLKARDASCSCVGARRVPETWAHDLAP